MATEERPKTVYIRGLPDKTPKGEMRTALYLFCSQFGPILEVHVPDTQKLHGQAWVVFATQYAASSCISELDGKIFYSSKKPLEVSISTRSSFLADPMERRRRDMRIQADVTKKRPREE